MPLHITRPTLANERVQCNAAGQVVLRLKTPWRDGTTHLVMSPLEFMQRLAALVPRPRLHLIRFHGVLAANAKLRAMVVPQGPDEATQAAQSAECEANCVHRRIARMSWARLLKRVFEIVLEHCPNCGGELKVIAAILEQPVIERILTHLGLQPTRSRSPPPVGRRCKRPDPQRPITLSGGPTPEAAGSGCARGLQGPRQSGLTVTVDTRIRPL